MDIREELRALLRKVQMIAAREWGHPNLYPLAYFLIEREIQVLIGRIDEERT